MQPSTNPLTSETVVSGEIWHLLQSLTAKVSRLQKEGTQECSQNLKFDEEAFERVLKENFKLKDRVEQLEAENGTLKQKISKLDSEVRAEVETRVGERIPYPQLLSSQYEDDAEDTVLSSEVIKGTRALTDARNPVEKKGRQNQSERSLSPPLKTSLSSHFVERFAVPGLKSDSYTINAPSSQGEATSFPSSPTLPESSFSPLRARRRRSAELDFGAAQVARIISGEADLSGPPLSVLSQAERSQPRYRVASLAREASSLSTVPDSQGDEDTAPLVLSPRSISNERADNRLSHVFDHRSPLDLTLNPERNTPWWPEDFAVNPAVNFGRTQPFKMRKVSAEYVHPALQTQFRFQKQHFQEESLRDFNRVALTRVTPDRSTNGIPEGALPTPEKTPEQALQNPAIDPVFKFEMNRTNFLENRSAFGSLSSGKIKLWLDLCDSPPGHDRSSFPNTQQLEQDRQTANKRAKLAAMQRLFQAIYMVESAGITYDEGDVENKPNGSLRYSQVGKFIFRNETFNEAVRSDNFTVDESIFHSAEDCIAE
ncbi:DEKNAAC100262 [Brettanomyces naardenensis]|uniref:DEKNAAC100262 n=1 Tax=Brettanomyces naardenensis TaxID=13370 RepID=A0A448YGP6_BRENA|nr:DEKNAAC100262 [Brettanomyces naardenensis]